MDLTKEHIARIDRLFARWDRQDSPGCALGIIAGGRLLTCCFGMADLEHDIPIGADTLFYAASMSKQFTAACVHLLAQEGRLALDEDVRRHLPELHDFGTTITLRHLLHHTSGLRDYFPLLELAGGRDEDVVTQEDALRLAWGQRELNFAPGAEYLYCNTGYLLLAEVVRRVSGRTLRQFAAERLFAPLGMRRSFFRDDHQEIVKDRACCYLPREGGDWRQMAFPFGAVGSGGLYTTVEDLARWEGNFDRPTAGGPALLMAMLAPGRLNDGTVLPYASGLVLGRCRGLETVSHAGGTAGYRAFFLRFPRERFAVILLGNSSDLNAGMLARQVAEVCLAGVMEPAPAPVSVPARLLDAYAGEYALPNGTRLVLGHEDGRLVLGGEPLVALSGSEFEAGDGILSFEEPVAGKARRVVLHRGEEEIRCPRVPPAVVPADPAQYAGAYYSEELGVLYTVRADAGRLLLSHPRGEAVLTPSGEDEFEGFHVVRFVEGGLVMESGRARGVRFRKVGSFSSSSSSSFS